ncbi:hypothetical protein K435DRAFT_862355 [Dendrothele bispora CBS 962.96]|uniref:Retrotransposon Copia-like N-terminal domain-containing protein n=1 Tax=Dendrothele bispora (strain CBS 962.96) TaxID=1314807 RepID=A0A4S8LU00_DENBC|nr:hypothetical protein K435DRAFT_862355 [Dendrothele bispora CBS 962.96]
MNTPPSPTPSQDPLSDISQLLSQLSLMALTKVKSPSHFQDFPSLNVAKGNWTEWSESCLDALLLVGLSEYVEGAVSKPADSATEQQAIWEHNDKLAKACIRMRLAQSEKTHVRECGTSKEVWDSLKSRHRKQGNITQISLIEEAFSICFAPAAAGAPARPPDFQTPNDLFVGPTATPTNTVGPTTYLIRGLQPQ